MRSTSINHQFAFEKVVKARMDEQAMSAYALSEKIARETGRSFVSTARRVSRAISGECKIELSFALEIADALGLELVIKEKSK